MNRPDRRQLLAWLVTAGMLLIAPDEAVAQGKGKGKGRSSSGGNGNGNSGGNNGGASSGAKGKGAAKPKANAANTPSGGPVLDHEAALKAVKDGEALPLRILLPQIEQRYGGEVIDAALQRIGRRLVYTLRMLSPGGRVFAVAVDAATGRPSSGLRFFGL
jgi:hypothetical protein